MAWMMVVLLLCMGVWGVSSHDGLPQLIRQEEMRGEGQVNLLNKPAVKSIETKDGDFFDCIEINNQPAIGHPLLKNHTIQMMPRLYPKGIIDEDPSTHIRPMGEECPTGTVPIHRAPKEDHKRAQFLPIFHEPSLSKIQPLVSPPGAIYQEAVYVTRNEYHGMKADLNIYGLPEVSIDQFSSSGICLSNIADNLDTYNTIQAGWMVNPRLYGDTKSRLYIYWTANGYQGTGCYNLLCPGYVQVDNSIPIGAAIEPLSHIGGDQFVIKIGIYKDPSTSNWWLNCNGKNLGYWPKELFQDLADHASQIKVGGLVGYLGTTEGPAMGNGHFGTQPDACYVSHIETLDKDNKPHSLLSGNPSPYTTSQCYKLSSLKINDVKFNFGGPAGCPGS